MQLTQKLKQKFTTLRLYVLRRPRKASLIAVGAVLFISAATLGVVALLGGPAGIQERTAQQTHTMSYEELRASGELQIFTHFPVDFDDFFAEPEEVLRKWQEHKDSGGAVYEHVSPPFAEFFFDPLNKGIGGRRWGFSNPHMPPAWNERLGLEMGEWPSYFVADVTLKTENIRIEAENDDPTTFDVVALTEADLNNLVSHEINGETVYTGISLLLQVNEHISYGNGGKEWVRKTIIDEVMNSGGSVQFPAGTHYGYGEGSFGLTDERIDSGGYPGAANPFDYFTDELQEELLVLYEPYHQYYKELGTEPFKDPTDSRQWWDEPGVLNGAWTNNDFQPDGFDLPDGTWRTHIGLVGFDYVNTETFWRILEHPWNVDNNMAGLWIENQEPHRFYLLDGNLKSGVGLAVHPWDEDENGYSWDPLEPDSATNHPSFGKHWYFRFEVTPHNDMWQQEVKIERFASEDSALAGFTDRAVVYQRGFHY